jgi:hypothetical protein
MPEESVMVTYAWGIGYGHLCLREKTFYSCADDLNYLTDVIAILFSGKLYIAHKYQIQVISINDKLE